MFAKSTFPKTHTQRESTKINNNIYLCMYKQSAILTHKIHLNTDTFCKWSIKLGKQPAKSSGGSNIGTGVEIA